MQNALNGLRQAERELAGHLESLRRVIHSIQSGEAGEQTRRPAGKRNLSAKGRAAIARAARKRWAAYRATKTRS